MFFAYIVLNDSVSVLIGETVVTGEDVQVTIACDQLIDDVVDETSIVWYKDETNLSNGSAINVEISANKSLCIITDTLLTVSGQTGTDGNYTCKVCNVTTCVNKTSPTITCGKHVLHVAMLNVTECLNFHFSHANHR